MPGAGALGGATSRSGAAAAGLGGAPRLAVWLEDGRVSALRIERVAGESRVTGTAGAAVEDLPDGPAALARAIAAAAEDVGGRGAPVLTLASPDDVTVCHVRVPGEPGRRPPGERPPPLPDAAVLEALEKRLGRPVAGFHVAWKIAGEVHGHEGPQREVVCLAVERARLEEWVAALTAAGLEAASAVFFTDALRALSKGRPCLWLGRRKALLVAFDAEGLTFARDLAATWSRPSARADATAAAPPAGEVPIDVIAAELKASLRHFQVLHRRVLAGPVLAVGPRATRLAEELSRSGGVEVVEAPPPEGVRFDLGIEDEGIFAGRHALGLGLAVAGASPGDPAPRELLPSHVRRARELRRSTRTWAATLVLALALCGAFHVRSRALRDYLAAQRDEARAELSNLRLVIGQMDAARAELGGLDASARSLEERLPSAARLSRALAVAAEAVEAPVACRMIQVRQREDGHGMDVEVAAEALTREQADALVRRLAPLAAAPVDGPHPIEAGVARGEAPAAGRGAPEGPTGTALPTFAFRVAFVVGGDAPDEGSGEDEDAGDPPAEGAAPRGAGGGRS
jgi:hypothetical protein